MTKLCKIVLNISPASFNNYHFNSMKTKNGNKTKENSTEMLRSCSNHFSRINKLKSRAAIKEGLSSDDSSLRSRFGKRRNLN